MSRKAYLKIKSPDTNKLLMRRWHVYVTFYVTTMVAGKNQAALAVCAQTKVIFPFKLIWESCVYYNCCLLCGFRERLKSFRIQNTEVTRSKHRTQKVLTQNTMSHIGFRTYKLIRTINERKKERKKERKGKKANKQQFLSRFRLPTLTERKKERK